MATASLPPSAASAPFVPVPGPSPYESDHASLVSQLTSATDEISRLTLLSADLQQQLAEVTEKRKAWVEAETARLVREEEERRAREEQERKEREERERIEREERERIQREERERKEKEERERKEQAEREEKERQRLEAERLQRLEQERREQEAREAAERAAQQAEKERLQREWLEKEKAETAQREEAEKREMERREREAALAAAGVAAAAQGGTAVPRELRLRCGALYDLEGDASNDELSFTTGETFLVSGEMNGWMSARSEKTGKVGLVPSNYLRVLEELEPPSAVPAAAVAVDSSNSSGAAVVGAQEAAVTDKKGELVVALFDFSGENDDELSFSTGDRLYKTGEVNGWYIGTHEKGDKVGIFPSNFVEMIAEPAAVSTAVAASLPDKAVEEKTAYGSSQSYSAAEDDIPLQSAPDVRRTKSTAFAAAEVASLAQAAQEANAPSTPRSGSGATSAAFSSPASPSSVANVEHDAIALYRFTATSSDQLSFEKGARLIIRNARLNGWYVGAVLGKDGPGPLGIFPANYVQRVEKEQPAAMSGAGAAGKGVEEQKQTDDEERSYRYKQQRMSGGSDAAAAAITSSVSSPSLRPPSGSTVSSTAPVIGRVTALYDFESTTAENLSFHRGDEICVVKEIKGWWAGFLPGKDKLGLVPSNYCSAFRPEPPGTFTTAANTATSSSAGPLPSQIVGGEWRPTANGAVVTSASSTSDASASTSGVTQSRVSSTPPPLSAKPVLLSSLAMSNAVSKGNVQMVTTVAPMSTMPNGINVSPVPAVNAASTSSSPAPLASASVTAASSSSSVSSAAPVTSVSAVPVSQQYPTVMATGPAYSSSSSNWSSGAPASAAAPSPATAVSVAPASYPVVSTTGPPAQPTGFTGSTAVQQPPQPAASTVASSPASVVLVPISTSSSRRSGERLAVAIHDWDTTERGELSFKKDDRLVITKEKQGWYTGYLEAAPQRKGMFPSMAVEPLSDASSTSSSSTAPSAGIRPSIAITASNSPADSAPSTPVSRGRSLSQNSTPSSVPPASASATVTQLERGMVVTKLDTRGRDPKQVRLYLEREKLSRNRRGEWIVRWDTKKFNKREAQVTIARCRVKRGLKRSSEAEPVAFTIIGPARDLEIICNDTNDREVWIDALMSLSVPLEQSLQQQDNNGVTVQQQQQQQQQQVVQVQQVQTTITTQQQQPSKEEEVSIHQILKDGPPASSDGSIPAAATAASAQPQPAAPAARDGSNYSGYLATALYDFGSEREDLAIVAGDRIELTEAEAGNQWWHGRNVTRGGPKVGMFPASYVQLDANPPVAAAKTVTVLAPSSSPGVTMAPGASAPVVSVLPASVPASGPSAAQPAVKAKAMYDFDTNGAEFPDDLPFKRNDVLTLISYGKDMEWWTGVDSKGRKGIFPATFVAIIG